MKGKLPLALLLSFSMFGSSVGNAKDNNLAEPKDHTAQEIHINLRK